jgi:uncharacterized protein YecT (DUF1311 family)
LTFFLETQEKNLKITQVVATSHHLPWIDVIYPPGSSQESDSCSQEVVHLTFNYIIGRCCLGTKMKQVQYRMNKAYQYVIHSSKCRLGKNRNFDE